MIFTKRGPRVVEEAAALEQARHPGVVELVGADDGVLRTRLVEGGSLAEAGPLPAEEVAGLAAAVASTLADLHERGVVHGGLDATHVLLAGDGRPVLCSLGRGGQPADDVAALGHLIADLLDRAPAALPRPRPRRAGRRLGPLLAPPAAPALAALAGEATHPDPARRPSARQLAAAVHGQVAAVPPRAPTARPLLPLSPPGGDRPAPARLAPRAAVVLAALALLSSASYALAHRGGPARPPAGTVAPSAAGAPAGAPGGEPDDAPAGEPDGEPDGDPDGDPGEEATDEAAGEPMARRVWPPDRVELRDGVLNVAGARYAVGRPGDQVVAGDWACSGRPTAVLLRPATGQVFAFDGWPDAGDELAGRPVARVPGGTALRATDTDGDGCADVEVVVADGPARRVEVVG